MTIDTSGDRPRPLFSRFYVRQMQPEQLYESLLAATDADAGLGGFDREAMKLAAAKLGLHTKFVMRLERAAVS